jgi:hypothetical protein
MRTSFAFALGSMLFILAAPCFADPNACEEPQDVDKYQLLRRLSLDLRNKPPSIDEYDAIDSVDTVPLATIQEYLQGDDFRFAMRRYHAELFWPNLVAASLFNQNSNIDIKSAPAYYIQAAGRQTAFRGGAVPCDDRENNDVDAQGRPNPAGIKTIGGYKQEGWRMIAPYWDPANKIKVCNFDAQEVETTVVKGETVGCNTVTGNASLECGCGTGLKYCYDGKTTEGQIQAALTEQLYRAIDKVTTAGAPYTDLMLSTHADENGKIAFWFQNLAPNTSYAKTYDLADPDQTIPALDYTDDDTWQDVDRGPMHAGLLTMPGYLLRFQTNRGRANRWRIVFTNQYFIPPAQLDPAPGCDPNANDLTKKCNCQYCHEHLEPLAAHFGKFAEAGTTLMSDDTVFPINDPDCVSDKPSGFCARFYVTDSSAENAGSLFPYQYSKDHPEYLDAIDAGPKQLAQQIIDDGTFANATVTELFTFFLKRAPVTDGSIFDEQKTVADLASGFKKNGYDFVWLTQQIVTLRQYGRTR